MKSPSKSPFETFLEKHDEEAWSATITILLRSVHEVDKNALQIWFAFYSLSLFQALEQSENPEKLAKELLMQGNYYLRDQIDSSHIFLYGHRYWAEIREAVSAYASSFTAESGSLSDQILAVAASASTRLQVSQSLLVAITAVAFMTIRQTGLETFASVGKALRVIR